MLFPETDRRYAQSVRQSTNLLAGAIVFHALLMGALFLPILWGIGHARSTSSTQSVEQSAPTPAVLLAGVNTPVLSQDDPRLCVTPAPEDNNVTPGQLGTPRCVNHCDKTLADPSILYWAYASFYVAYEGHPCPAMPPYAPTSTVAAHP